jgi:hypothetical protein
MSVRWEDGRVIEKVASHLLLTLLAPRDVLIEWRNLILSFCWSQVA